MGPRIVNTRIAKESPRLSALLPSDCLQLVSAIHWRSESVRSYLFLGDTSQLFCSSHMWLRCILRWKWPKIVSRCEILSSSWTYRGTSAEWKFFSLVIQSKIRFWIKDNTECPRNVWTTLLPTCTFTQVCHWQFEHKLQLSLTLRICRYGHFKWLSLLSNHCPMLWRQETFFRLWEEFLATSSS